jgi:hypothetical protein
MGRHETLARINLLADTARLTAGRGAFERQGSWPTAGYIAEHGSEGADTVTDYEADVAAVERMAEEVRRIRTRTCEPKSNQNPRYLALSNVVSNLMKAIDDMRVTDI